MPQNGFHGLFGLAAAKAVVPRVRPSAAVPVATGVVIGSMLPDIDMVPTAIAFLMGRTDLTYEIHRTATHSLAFAGLIALAGLAVPRWRAVLIGLSLGVATHLLLDVFFWFKPVDLFWPFSRSGLGVPIVDLWRDEQLTGLWANFRESLEFAAFATLIGTLRRIAKRGVEMLRWERAMWAAFAVALVTAFVFRSRPSTQNVIVTTPYLLCFLPYTWTQVYKLRFEIAAWAKGVDGLETRSARPA